MIYKIICFIRLYYIDVEEFASEFDNFQVSKEKEECDN